jgi:hypothetical protein
MSSPEIESKFQVLNLSNSAGTWGLGLKSR